MNIKSPINSLPFTFVDEICLSCQKPFRTKVINGNFKNRDRLCSECKRSGKRKIQGCISEVPMIRYVTRKKRSK